MDQRIPKGGSLGYVMAPAQNSCPTYFRLADNLLVARERERVRDITYNNRDYVVSLRTRYRPNWSYWLKM